MIETLNNYVERLNNALRTSTNLKDDLNQIIAEMESIVEYSGLYFSKEVYVAFMGREYVSQAIKQDLLVRPEEYEFQISDDPEEHPGVVIYFKSEEE